MRRGLHPHHSQPGRWTAVHDLRAPLAAALHAGGPAGLGGPGDADLLDNFLADAMLPGEGAAASCGASSVG
eukprot:3704591-Lingulodinium_polyedra.AAC.1